MSRGHLLRVVFAIFVCAVAFGSVAADWRFRDLFDPPGILFTALPLLSFAVVGSLLVVRRAGGPIGWLLGVAGALLQLVALSQAYGYSSLYGGAALPRGDLVLWFGSALGNAVLVLIIAAMVRFPDGRPPNRTFAILLWVVVVVFAILTVASALADQPIPVPLPYTGLQTGDPPRSIPNPFAVHGMIGDLLLLVVSAINSFIAPVLIAPLALVVRLRRSRGVERQQLKWLTYTAALVFGILVAKFAIPEGSTTRLIGETTTVFGLGLLPVAIGIAITRYRLYDIDVLIRRTLVYAAVSGVLLATYVAGVALLQTVLAPLTAGSGVAVAISTLAVVALFQPARTRIQGAVDRRFYRAKYDAERTLDRFAGRLRDQVELESVRAELLTAVGETLQPSHASVWLRKAAP